MINVYYMYHGTDPKTGYWKESFSSWTKARDWIQTFQAFLREHFACYPHEDDGTPIEGTFGWNPPTSRRNIFDLNVFTLDLEMAKSTVPTIAELIAASEKARMKAVYRPHGNTQAYKSLEGSSEEILVNREEELKKLQMLEGLMSDGE